jgi:hypothetical protein
VMPVVTEYQLHRLVCLICGGATQAELPLGVPAGEFGPRGTGGNHAVHGGLSPVEADDAAGHGRPL